MSRISISLPDELTARLEPIKENINISQVCREALERRIAIFEQSANQPDADIGLESLVARLREERTLAEGHWEKLGIRNATVWLQTASYVEIKETMKHQGASNSHKVKLPRAAFHMMKQEVKDAKGSLEGPEAIVYKTAWFDYVGSVWAQVTDETSQDDKQRVGVEE